MVTGASTADLAIVLVDARRGVLEQTRRHVSIVAMLGVHHVAVALNKMDLVDWSEERFREIETELRALAEQVGIRTCASSRSRRSTATTSWTAATPRRGTTGRRSRHLETVESSPATGISPTAASRCSG